MDAEIAPSTGDYTGQRISTLANAVYVRLATPLGSYWADPTVGSKLYLLKREKDLPRILVLAEQYAEQALQPLIDDGRAQSVEVTATHLRTGWVLLTIDVVDQTGETQTFKHPVKVI